MNLATRALLTLFGFVLVVNAQQPKNPEMTVYYAFVVGDGTIEGADKLIRIGPDRSTRKLAEDDEKKWNMEHPNTLRLTGVKEEKKNVSQGKQLGWLSQRYEVGKGGPGTISTGKGDKGGVSYGTYQLSSKAGTAQRFVDRFYPKEFMGLTPGSAEFSAMWTKVAKANPTEFKNQQHEFIQQTHFDPVVAKVKKDAGVDFMSRSEALQNVIWSTAVQHGAHGGSNVVEKAIGDLKIAMQPLTDANLIQAIYDERGRKHDKGNLVHFRGNSQEVQNAVAKRFERERQDALNALTEETKLQGQ